MSVLLTLGGLFVFAVVAASLLARDPNIALAGVVVIAVAAWIGALVAFASRVARAR